MYLIHVLSMFADCSCVQSFGSRLAWFRTVACAKADSGCLVQGRFTEFSVLPCLQSTVAGSVYTLLVK